MRRRRFAAIVFASLAAVASAPAASQAPAAPSTFVLYASPSSRPLIERDALDLKARVNRWRDLVKARGASFAIATHPAQLAQMPPAVALILPSAVVLSEEERRVILRRVDAGESLLATWMPGTLDAKAAPASGAFLEQVFKVSTRPAPNDERGFLVTVGDTPLTHALPAGTRLWVGRDKRFPTPLLATPGAGYLADWSRAPGETGLMAYTTVGRSRRALLGFNEMAWEGQPNEFRKLAEMALDWVEGRPVAYARSWPWPYRGAMTFGVDALWRFENVPRIASLLAEHGAHGSFHFLPADVYANATLIRDLVKSHHSVGGFGDAAQPFAGQSEAVQRARIERMVQGFRNTLGPDFVVAGLRAPQGVTDVATEKAAASLAYLVDVGRVDSVTPVMGSAQRRPVLLPASANIGSNAKPEAIAPQLDLARNLAQVIGGYAFVGVDAAGFLKDSAIEAEVSKFVEATWGKAKLVWPASAEDVAQWWREREQVQVGSAWDAASATLTLTVTAREAMRFPLAISLVPPPGRSQVEVDGSVSALRLSPAPEGGAAIVLSELPAGEHRLRVRFQP